MTKTNSLSSLLIVSAFGLCLYGCAGPTERGAASPPVVPMPGKALVVFVRPPAYITIIDYGRIPVFEAKKSDSVTETAGKDSEPEIIGILPVRTMVAYHVDPGRHLFMVLGQFADFMTADVLPNRTYYVFALARPGKFRALYSLKAVDKQEQGSKDFKEIIASFKWVVKTPEALNYAASNMAAIRSRQDESYRVWIQKAESERPRLLPDDGVDPQSRRD